jgi:hypothetical protein
MSKFAEIPYFTLDEYFDEISFVPEPVITESIELLNETDASWGPEYHGLSLVDGNAFLRVEGVTLTYFTSGSYSISLHDSAGKTAEGWIGYKDITENLGSELMTDTGFAASASWSTDQGWVVSGGKGNFNSASYGSVWQQINVVRGTLYKLQFTVDSVSAQSFMAATPGNWIEKRTSSGTYTEYFVAISTAPQTIGFWAHLGTAVVDNISLKEVIHVGTDGIHVVSTDGGAIRNWTSIEQNFRFNDDSYTFEVKGLPAQTDTTLIGDRHSIITEGGYWTKLYIDLDGTLTEIKFRSDPTEWVNEDRYFIFTKDPSGADFSNGDDAYFRKDSYLHDYLRGLAATDSTYSHYLNLQKPFIYFGKIFLTDASTGESRVEYRGMRDFAIESLPEHSRTEKLVEYLDLYYDRTHSEIYAMLKNIITLIDPKEVDIDFLGYIADMYSITISEALSANQWTLTEVEQRDFVSRIIHWLKRKGTYAALYILWKLLTGTTSNVLNIYERWHDGATPGPPSFASFIDYLYVTYYGDVTGDNLVLNGDMEIDDYWDDFNSPAYNIRSSTYAYNGSYSRKFAASDKDDGIQSQGFTTVLNENYECSAWVYPYLTDSAKIHLTTGSGTGEVISQEYSNLTEDTWNYIEVSGAQQVPGDDTRVVISQTGGDALVTGDNSDFDTIGDWYTTVGTISSVGGGNPGNCLKVLNDEGHVAKPNMRFTLTPAISGAFSGHLTFDIKSNVVVSGGIRPAFSGSAFLGGSVYAVSTNWMTQQWYFTIPAGHYMDLFSIYTWDNVDDGVYFMVDNVSITEISDENAVIYVDNVSVNAFEALPEYPAEYDGYGDNWTLSPHYKVEIDMTNQPFGNDYIMDEPTLFNLMKYWEMVRPVGRVSHYLEYISPTADFTGYWNSLYSQEFLAVFNTILLDPPLEPAVGTDFYLQTAASDAWTAVHNLSTLDVLVQCFDVNSERLIAEEIYPLDANTIYVDLAAPDLGTVYMATSTSTVSASPSAAWAIAHNQGDDILTYFTDESRNRIYPDSVTLTDTNNLLATFGTTVNGYCFTRAGDVKFTQTTPSYSWTVLHSLDVGGVMVNFYDVNNVKIYPDIVQIGNTDTLTATFSTPTSGYAVVVGVGAPVVQGSLWTPLTSGYIELGNGSNTDVWNPWSANDLKSSIVTIPNGSITYTEAGNYYYVSFELPLTAIEDNITEIGLFNVSDELVFYSYCDPIYKASECGFRMRYRIEK